MSGTSVKHIQHLYWRAGFGITAVEADKLSDLSIAQIIQQLFETPNPEYLKVIDWNTIRNTDKTTSKLTMREIIKYLKEFKYGEKLNATWLEQLAFTKNPLLEKTTLFWHGHFACRIENIYFIQELNNIERKYAFGPFKDLLLAVSKSPAMLQFLNNQQNKKMHPNENFARELMELFTIGRGNYTETDIKESARAFTGWGFDKDNLEFTFRERQHDEGDKTFFGKTGNFAGEDIINIILEDKRTSTFICRKMYKFFVNDIPDEAIIATLSDYYYSNNYNTGNLLRKIFTSDWFYDDKNMGTSIKSPVSFIAGLTRSFNIKYNDDKVLLMIQKGLGQVLFFPPNVAGWAGGKSWIDSSTLMLRLKLPSMIINGGVIDFDAQGDDPDTFKMMEQESRQQEKVKDKVKTTIDWDAVAASFPKGIGKEKIVSAMLQPTLSQEQKDKLLDAEKETLSTLLIQLVSLPEYQMC